MKRTKYPLKVGGYATLDRKQYRRVRKATEHGTFHTTDYGDHFKIKIIDEDILQAVLKVI